MILVLLLECWQDQLDSTNQIAYHNSDVHLCLVWVVMVELEGVVSSLPL